jgi:hypothetical protein
MKAVAMARKAGQLRPSEARVLLDDAFLLAWNALARSRELRWSPELRAALHRNRSIQGVARGERCWILGGGASLAGVDLGALRSEHVFILDPLGLGARPGRATCAPRYLVVTGRADDAPAWTADAAAALGRFGPDTWIFAEPDDHACMATQASLATHRRFVVVPNQRFVFGYDRAIDLTRGIPGVEDTAKTAIAIAVWMGFRRINLLGVDGDGVLSNGHQAEGDQTALERSLVRSSLGLRGWRALVAYLERRQIALVSMSPHSVLTGLPTEPFAV